MSEFNMVSSAINKNIIFSTKPNKYLYMDANGEFVNEFRYNIRYNLRFSNGSSNNYYSNIPNKLSSLPYETNHFDQQRNTVSILNNSGISPFVINDNCIRACGIFANMSSITKTGYRLPSHLVDGSYMFAGSSYNIYIINKYPSRLKNGSHMFTGYSNSSFFNFALPYTLENGSHMFLLHHQDLH